MPGRSGWFKNPSQDDGDNDVRHAKWKPNIICSRYSRTPIQSRPPLAGTARGGREWVRDREREGRGEERAREGGGGGRGNL